MLHLPTSTIQTSINIPRTNIHPFTMEQLETEIKKMNTFFKWSLICLAIFFVVCIILAATSAALAYNYRNKIYPGVKIDNLNLGGLTKTQALNIVGGKFHQVFDPGFTFTFEDTTKTITDPDNKIFMLNTESLIDQAFNVGHADNFFKQYVKLLIFPITKKNVPVDYRLDKDLLKESLKNEFAILEKPAINSALEINVLNAEKKESTFNFTNEQAGETFNFNDAIAALETDARRLENKTISLTRHAEAPTITRAQAQNMETTVLQLLALPDVQLKFEDKVWPVKWIDFTHWLELGLNDEENVAVRFNAEMVMGHLQAIAQEIDQPATDAKLQMQNERVTEFIASQNGQALDMEANLKEINQEILINKNTAINLIVNITEPKVAVASTNDLGIKELIGVGYSNFAGSPANRRHNIGVGAATLNGVLIPSGGEFSLVKTLGEIDGQHGYLQELVIKKNETKPEYGGGLCQIGTTVFRAALQSGLPITMRQNHSYRVVYYEPAGTDATIYDPWPDMKFVNDTANYVLIQAKLIGNNLSFEFWGARDGRHVSFEGNNVVEDLKQLKPKIFNITTPGPKREVETEELEPGKKKKVESAHNGADASFNRTVVKADGTEMKETWKSHYVPWQEVWLIGVDPVKKAAEAAALEALKTEQAAEAAVVSEAGGQAN